MARTEDAKIDLNCILIDSEGVFVVKQTGVEYQLINQGGTVDEFICFFWGGGGEVGGGIRW